MENLESVLGLVGGLVFLLGFGLLVVLSEVHGGRCQRYIVQAYSLGKVTGFALCLIAMFFAMETGMGIL